jgi:AhpD family alkylhydroperoxidase
MNTAATPAMKFSKRTYKNPKEFFSDLRFIISNRKKLKEITAKRLISPAFRERLMLAVTAVNGCRYCSYFHTRQALKNESLPLKSNNCWQEISPDALKMKP